MDKDLSYISKGGEMMERLTQINGNNEVYCIVDDKKIVVENIDMLKICQRLKLYEDLEEQGLLLRLPCKVGDTVWVVTSPFNVFEGIEYNKNLRDECYESFISSVTFYKNSVQYRINAKVTNHFISAFYNEHDFGKTVFLTKSEAERKLKEMENK